MKRMCSICARGGSKGVKNKNIRDLLGTPLIAYSLIQARASKLFDVIAVSSDSDLILDIAKQWGADYLIKRPDELATDQSPKLPVIGHCLLEVEKITGTEFEVIVDLDATSPLRNVADIITSVQMLEEKQVSNVITGMLARRSPYFNLVELKEDGSVGLSKQLSKPISRRQDAPICYDMNASIYVWQRATLLDSDTLFHSDTQIHLMPEERSIDIDTPFDFELVEFIMNREGRVL